MQLMRGGVSREVIRLTVRMCGFGSDIRGDHFTRFSSRAVQLGGVIGSRLFRKQDWAVVTGARVKPPSREREAVFKRKSPLAYWDESPSRIGWSVLDGRLVAARGVQRGKRLQLRFTDDGSFMFPLGILPKGARQLLDAELWNVAPEVVDEVTGGMRVATAINEMFGHMLHNRHAEVILYRIAHGMLYPDDELVKTLGIVPSLNEGKNRIDIVRVRASLLPDRVPTDEEFAETHAEFVRREAELDGIMAVLESEESTQETISAAVERIEEHADNNPFELDGAPYLKGAT